jgi:UDP-N-acetylmuramate dehydrogenase
MNQSLKYRELFSKIYSENGLETDALMSNHISFKVGGKVDLLLKPESIEQVSKSIKLCRENSIPYYIIGNGSNLLVRDGGIRGVVIKLSELKDIIVDDRNIKAYCGALLKDVSDIAMKHSLSGIEFACGIPGSIGGAVFMNAGAYDGEIKNVIIEAEVIDKNGDYKVLKGNALEFGYRTSNIKSQGYIVVSATLGLIEGDKQKIVNRVDELTKRREEKQPLEYPSAGSTFKRPEGYFAGKLIQDAGLKGFSIGGAQVSEKHSGFVINKGNATATDILNLIKHIQSEVKRQFGVELEPEVRILGED